MVDTRSDMRDAVNRMHASGRGSALYGTLVQCSDFLLQQMLSYGPEEFNYEVVVLSDGNGDDYLAFKKDLDNLVSYVRETTTVGDGCAGRCTLYMWWCMWHTVCG